MSFLSAKKPKFALVKYKLFNNSTSNSFTLPLAIKFFKLPSSLKKISISDINLPFLILLLIKLLKFDGLIIDDSLFS